MTRTTNDTKISFRAKTAIIGAGFAVLAALIATTSILNYAGDRRDTPTPASSAAPTPRESAPTAASMFQRAITNCGTSAGVNSFAVGDRDLLTVQISYDETNASPEGLACLTKDLGMPGSIAAELGAGRLGDTGAGTWPTGYGTDLDINWTFGVESWAIVISGQGERDGGL